MEDIIYIISNYLPNKKIIDFIKKDDICWYNLCKNPNAINLIENNLDKLDEKCWLSLCSNKSLDVINLIKKNMDKLKNDEYWNILSENYYAVDIILNNIDKCKLIFLCKNENPKIIEYLEKNIDKFSHNEWVNICYNKNAINIIKNNLNTIINELKNHFNIELIGVIRQLCSNENSYDIIINYIDIFDMYCWYALTMSNSKNFIKLIDDNFDNIITIYSFKLYTNEYAYDILKKYNLLEIKSLNILQYMSLNSCDEIINIVENHLKENPEEYIYSEEYLCKNKNPKVLNIIKKYSKKINKILLENPIIFEEIDKNIIINNISKNIIKNI